MSSQQMTTIEVSPAVAAIIQEWKEQAQEQGIDLAELIQSIVIPGGIPLSPEQSVAGKIQELRKWSSSHDDNPAVILDDRREILYEDKP